MSARRIEHATIVLPDRLQGNCVLEFEDESISFLGFRNASNPFLGDNTIDLEGDYLIPGLIDTHVHGARGFDVMDGTEASLEALSLALAQEGTTAYLPTTMSCSLIQLAKVMKSIAGYRKHSGNEAEILGVHLEGPFLSPRYKGAQAPETILPANQDESLARLEELFLAYPRLIRLITLAIERSDARELIRLSLENHVIPSVGHSEANYDQMQQAVDWGLRHVTHAFNSMPEIHHRNPGLLSKALLDSRIWLELIADGVHIHPAVLDLTLRLKPPDRVCLVSDGTRAVGMPDGNYELGGQQILVRSGMVRLADGTLAGSAYPLLQGVRTIVHVLNYPIFDAVRFASLNPARLLGIDQRLGSLEVGKEATFVRLSTNLELKQVWIKGKRVKGGDK